MGIPTPHIEAKCCEDFAKTVLAKASLEVASICAVGIPINNSP